MIEIEVTTKDGARLAINLEYIESVSETKDGTLIRLMLFKKWIVRESFDEVLRRIEEANAKDIFSDI